MTRKTLAGHTRIIIPVLFIMGLIYKVNANPTMDAKLYNPTFSGTGASTTYTVTLAVKSNDPSENLGNSIFIFTYNSTDLSIPSSPSSGTDYSFSNFSGSAYNSGTVTRPSAGIINVNISLPYGNTGTDISSGFVDVCTITFSVLNLGVGTNSNLAWAMSESGPPTMDDVYDDDANTSFTSSPLNFDENTFTGLNTTSLPVSLLHFTAQYLNNEVAVKWSTASEKNNQFFSVEKSGDGLHFSEFQRVEGAGNSEIRRDYVVFDEAPRKGITYYRLRQTDINGQEKTFPIVALDINALNDLKILAILPGGEGKPPTVNFNVPSAAALGIALISSSGEVIREVLITARPGYNSVYINGNWKIHPGIYSVVLCYNGKFVCRKFESF